MLLTKDSSVDSAVFLPDGGTVKKMRHDSTSSNEGGGVQESQTFRNLEMENVKELFQNYDLLTTAGAVACVICGKLYKSKVCVKKHLWEHSVYWDLFDGLKKQQRVLSIQAALILAIKFNPSLSLLLVTQPSNNNKKQKSEKLETKRASENTNINDSNIRKNDLLNNNNHNNSQSDGLNCSLSSSRKRKFNDIIDNDKRTFEFNVYEEINQHVGRLQPVEVSLKR